MKDLTSPIGQLITSGAVEKALKEGEQAPDFTLPDALGKVVTLSHLLKQGPVVITFYRIDCLILLSLNGSLISIISGGPVRRVSGSSCQILFSQWYILGQ